MSERRKTPRILVVAAGADRAELYRLWLADSGFAPITARSGRTGLQRFKSEDCDMALVEAALSDLSGFVVARRMRAARPECPVVVVSALQEASELLDGLRAGVASFVVEPSGPAQLAERLRHVRRMWANRSTEEGEPTKVHLGGRKHTVKLNAKQLVEVLASTSEELIRARAEALRWAAQQGFTGSGALESVLYDELTGLPNRALFLDRLTRSIKQAQRRSPYLFSVLCVDIDRLKIVNDSLGFSVGNALLSAIAQRLGPCVRGVDTVARTGGDEFLILLDDIRDASDATRVATRIRQALSNPFVVGGQEVFVTASIGIALHPSGYVDPEHVIRDASAAMHRAKALGKDRHEMFDADMHQAAIQLLRLETDLRRAVEREEFGIHYQPIIAMESGNITGFEALVRWHHPGRGLLSPIDFIPVAEETGLVVPIDRLVMRAACRQIRIWQEQYGGSSPLWMSVNLSRKQFARNDLVESVSNIIKDSGCDARVLRLELTESVVMSDADAAVETLRQLKELGLQLSIDDFGTGYSSLSSLHRFPIDTLKIDRAFVGALGCGDLSAQERAHDGGTKVSSARQNAEIVRTIVSLAQTLNMDVVAEGVETDAQLAELRALRCDYGQGYLFARPAPSESVGALLKASPHW